MVSKEETSKKCEENEESSVNVIEADFHEEIIEIVKNEEVALEQNGDKEQSASDEWFWTLDENSTKESLDFSSDECYDKFCNEDELNGHKEISRTMIDFQCQSCSFCLQTNPCLRSTLKFSSTNVINATQHFIPTQRCKNISRKYTIRLSAINATLVL